MRAHLCSPRSKPATGVVRNPLKVTSHSRGMANSAFEQLLHKCKQQQQCQASTVISINSCSCWHRSRESALAAGAPSPPPVACSWTSSGGTSNGIGGHGLTATAGELRPVLPGGTTSFSLSWAPRQGPQYCRFTQIQRVWHFKMQACRLPGAALRSWHCKQRSMAPTLCQHLLHSTFITPPMV